MPSASSAEHKKKAAERGPVSVAIVTVSDPRTPETDASRGSCLKATVAGCCACAMPGCCIG